MLPATTAESSRRAVVQWLRWRRVFGMSIRTSRLSAQNHPNRELATVPPDDLNASNGFASWPCLTACHGRENDQVRMTMPPTQALRAASDRSNSCCGRSLYSTLAETFRTFRGIDFATRVGRLFDLLKSRAIAGGANNLSQSFMRSFHRDQSLKQNKN